MRAACVALLMVTQCWGQVRATFEPMGDLEVKETMGLKIVTAWNVTVESNQATVNRGEVERLTPFTELRPSMAEDLITKAASGDPRTVVGKGWDGVAPLAGPGLMSYGFAASNPWSIGVGIGITVGGIFRGIFKDQPPDGTRYIQALMPDQFACKAGYCGNYLVLTSKIGSPVKVEVGSLTAGLLLPANRLGFSGGPFSGLPIQAGFSPADSVEQPRVSFHAASDTPIVTHPQLDEPIIYDTARIAAMIRERSAAIGAEQ